MRENKGPVRGSSAGQSGARGSIQDASMRISASMRAHRPGLRLGHRDQEVRHLLLPGLQGVHPYSLAPVIYWESKETTSDYP
jgi:hypothetical protein